VVVEAALRSGSLITARMAGEQGREVMAVPGSPLDPRCRGTNRLIREGAALIEDAEQILEILTGLRHQSIEIEQPLSEIDQPIDFAADRDVDKTRRDVLGRLGPSPIAVDELLRQCQSSPPVIGQVLLELDLAGRLERHPGNRVSLLAAP
jgi:DNA processing protein